MAPVLLRPVRLDDAELLSRWYNDPFVRHYMSTWVRAQQHTPATIAESLRASDPAYERLYMIEAPGHDTPVGHAGIDDIDWHDRRGEIFFLIGDPAARGKGYASQTAALLVDEAFVRLGLNSLFASATVMNAGSIKALERAGFQRIGTFPEYNRLENEIFVDEELFALTRKRYDKLREGAR